MGRRGQECRCCGCPGCNSKPTLLRATIEYPSGGGVTLFADPDNDPPEWQDVTTDCSIEQARRFVQRVRITNPGEGYTEAPMLAITGGGGTPSLDAYIEITSGVVGIDVDDGGSGFSTPPAVKFLGGGKIETATAQAVIAGTITSVTLTSGGEGYSAPPAITFAGGQGAAATAVMNGYVASIAVVDGGEGYTSAPAVTLSGGGGTEAAAQAFISTTTGKVTAVFVTNKGAAYTSPPTVEFSGGGGTDAKATASVLYSVSSVTLTAGGDGYPFQPAVGFEGPATTPAQASAAIEGSVIAVQVANPGRYRHRRNAAGTVLIDWPTISISGATATPRFSGPVTEIDPGNVASNTIRYESAGPGSLALLDNKNYESAPSVSITGGNGSGAAAVAELNWLDSHERTVDVESCIGRLSSESCYFAESEAFPLPPKSECGNSAERFEWNVAGLFTLDAGASFVNFFFGQPSSLSEFTAFAWLFNGEGAIVIVSRGWGAGSVDTSYDCLQTDAVAREIRVDYLVARKFSRVPPDVTYRVSFPVQPAEATNASVTPEWTQYVDSKGDSFWFLESLTVTSGGSNLFFPPNSELRLAADGNAIHEFLVAEFAFSRQAPAAAIGDLAGFQSQPSVTISLSEFGSPAQTFYRISAAAIASGGNTDLEDGPVQIPVVLTQGHWASAPVTLAGTIASGQLTSIALPVASQQILAPATLTAATPQDDPNFNNPARVTTGRSAFRVTYTHTQPTVSARAVPLEAGADAVFNVVLAEKTDLNGDLFWEIESAVATDVGSGHTLNSGIVLELESPGIEAVAPVLEVVLAREAPAFQVGASAGGLGPFFIEGLQAQLAERAGEFGDPYWEITGVVVPEGAILPFEVLNNNQGRFLFFSDGVECRVADVTYTTDNAGFLAAVQVNDGGNYFLETDGVRRLHVLHGGRFFIRNFNVSSEPLPSVSCIGPVSKAAGWDRNQVLLNLNPFYVFPPGQVEVGEQYGLRVRRCPLPDIDVEIE